MCLTSSLFKNKSFVNGREISFSLQIEDKDYLFNLVTKLIINICTYITHYFKIYMNVKILSNSFKFLWNPITLYINTTNPYVKWKETVINLQLFT